MKKIFFSFFILFLFLTVSKISFSQDNDATNTDVNVPKTETTGDVCIVTGEAIAEGNAVVYNYMGTDYKFCCKNCVKKFKAEPLDYIKGELKCPISGESASKENFTVVDDVKYYFCCSHCKEKFEKEPEKYLNKEKKEELK
jgi:YHS domain-containing protein